MLAPMSESRPSGEGLPGAAILGNGWRPHAGTVEAHGTNGSRLARLHHLGSGGTPGAKAATARTTR